MIVRRLSVAATVATLLMVSAARPGIAQDLHGRVTLADSLPAGGVRVELHSVSETAASIVDSSIAASDGRFEFLLPESEEPGAVFLVGARYGGVLYWGPRFTRRIPMSWSTIPLPCSTRPSWRTPSDRCRPHSGTW